MSIGCLKYYNHYHGHIPSLSYKSLLENGKVEVPLRSPWTKKETVWFKARDEGETETVRAVGQRQ